MSFYGKMPCLGDYLADDADDAFTDPWHAWVLEGLGELETVLREQWREQFLTAPIWRFGLSPGVFGDRAVIGAVAPSVDMVGRAYPLVLYTELKGERPLLELFSSHEKWFEESEDILLAALGDDIDTKVVRQRAATHCAALPECRLQSRSAEKTEGILLVTSCASEGGLGGLLVPLVALPLSYSVWWSAYGHNVEISPGEVERRSALLVTDGPPTPALWRSLVGA
ncbi:MAG: type VI secretion system-associated protein TagF [Pseudomonadota bacterium]